LNALDSKKIWVWEDKSKNQALIEFSSVWRITFAIE